MQTFRPTKSRILVFSVPVKRRKVGSLIYLGNQRRGSYSGCQECWVIALGPEVSIDLKVGQKAFVHDGFEFERVKLPEIWEGLKDTAPFSDLKAFVEAVDGDVEVEIIPEGSVLAVED